MSSSTPKDIPCERSGKKKVDGVDLYYEIHGTGPHICIFNPALIGSAARVRPIIDKMNQKEFTFVIWDPPGYGKSRPPDRNVFTEKYPLHLDAIFAGKLMQTLGFEKYSVIGWSNAGTTALFNAAEFSENVNKVVICNVAARYDDRVKRFLEFILDMKNWKAEQKALLLEDYEEKYVIWMIQTWIKCNEDRWRNFNQYYDKLELIKSPTLYIQSKHDYFAVQNSAEFYKQRIKNCEVQIIPYGSHDYMEFLPDFIKATEKFLLEA